MTSSSRTVLASLASLGLFIATVASCQSTKTETEPTTTTTTTTTTHHGGGGAGNTGNTGGTGNTGNVGNTGGTGNTGNTGNTGGSGNTGNSGNTGGVGGAGGAPAVATITEVRAMADGVVSPPVQVQGAYVTYTRDRGFYLQTDQLGPGLYVYTADPNTPATYGVAVGNQIALRVDSVATFNGTKEVDGFAVLTNDGGTYDVVANLAQDISSGAGVAPSETTESELLEVANMHITGGASPNFTATIGSGNVAIAYYNYQGDVAGLCTGATLDAKGVGGDNNATYSLRSYYAADATNVNTSACTAANMDNWDFEDWATMDPCPGFVKATGGELANYQMNQSTTNHHGGASSAAVTWTTTNTVEINTSYRYPVTVGTQYTCHYWVLDNDPAGQTRQQITFYDAANVSLGNNFTGTYSSDNISFVEYTYQMLAPANAATMSCGIRFYDVGAGFTTATVYIDDLSITP